LPIPRPDISFGNTESDTMLRGNPLNDAHWRGGALNCRK
jgi:hypothetical protein